MAQLSTELKIWQRPEWPYFQWDSSALLDSLVKVRHQQGRLLALAGSLPSADTKSLNESEIQKDIRINGFLPLSKERLFGWQASIFPTGYSGISKINVGEFRRKDFTLRLDTALPTAKNLNAELKKFLDWWNDSPVGLDGIIRAGLAYFWFVTLQPFEDGNLTVAQGLLELALRQDEKITFRPYDLAKIFMHNQVEHQNAVELGQKSNGDITAWLKWLFEQLTRTIDESLDQKLKLASRNLFWKKTETMMLSSRQRKIISHFLSLENINGIMTNREFVVLFQISRESIKRDFRKLVELNLLIRNKNKGRAVEYQLALPQENYL